MAGYLSIFAPEYKMASQKRTQMNGGSCQSKNSCDDRSSVSNSRREDTMTSFGFGGDCVGSSSDDADRNATTTCRMPGMMFGRTAPSTGGSRPSSDSSYPPHVSFVPPNSSGRTAGSAAVASSTDGHLHIAECCDDQFRRSGSFREAESRQRNSRTRGYNQQVSEYEENGSKNHFNLDERNATDSRFLQGPADFYDFRSQSQRCTQDAEPANQNSRSSYFLNLSAMDRNSGRQNETRKLASTPSKSSSVLTSADHGSRGPGALIGQTPLTNRSILRKNIARDDQSLYSPMADTPFSRGGVRRSLQLPKYRPPPSGRILAGISPLGSERNRSFRTTNLSNVGTSHNGSVVRSPLGREKADDRRSDVNGRSLNNGTAKMAWPRQAQDEYEDEGREDTMRVRFQEIYGTIGRKSKLNPRNAESSSSMRNGFGSLTQSTSLAQLPQRSPRHDLHLLLQRDSVTPTYQRGGADGAADWNDPVYDTRNNLNRVYGSMSPMLSSTGRPKTGIPVLVGQQVAGSKH